MVMRRWIGGLAVAALLGLPLCAQDKAKDKGPDRAEEFKKVKDDFEKARAAASEAYQAAKTQEEQKAAIDKLQKAAALAATRVLELVKADPKDDQSLNMLLWATGSGDARVFDALAEHHAKNPKIRQLVGILTAKPREEAAKFLQKVLADNPEKDVKGLACYALAQAANEKAAAGDKAAAEEAEKLFARVEKEFADVKLGVSTLGEAAKGALFEMRNLAVGMTAPNVESQDLEGNKVALKDYRGKVVVLDIWATWCPPCRAMIPHEREMVKKLKGQPFVLVSISADEKKETLKEFLDKESMPWTHWWNGATGGVLKDWNIRFFPTIYVLDAKGVIRAKNVRGKELEDTVEKLLAEGKK
jgi:thiol-disulfide isomerase/thioredoxin